MAEDLKAAIELLDQCATALARTGGMMNRDLAHEVTKFTALAKAAPTKPATEKAGV